MQYMKAAVLEETNRIVCQDVELPETGVWQVRVRVHYTGVCGSDVPRALEGRVHAFPLVLGHEFSGTVEAVGEGVSAELLDKRVAGIPLIPCMECADCQAGHYSLCKTYGFVGSRQAGSMAECVVVPARNVFPVADDVTDLEAAFFEPATVALHGIELAGVVPGGSAIVLGGGTIGILCAQALAAYGIDHVVVTRRSEAGFVPVLAAGLENVVATGEEGWQDKARKLAGCDGFDYVFDTAGTPETILDAFEMAGNRATVCFVGTPKRDVAFTVREWENINRKELTVTGSWMSYSAPWPGVEWQRASELFAAGTMRVVDEMVDSVYPLARTQDALQRFAAAGGVKGKILIGSRA